MKKRSSFSYYSKFNSDSSDSDSSDSDSSDSDSYIKNNVKKKINIPHKKKENKPKLNDKEEKEIFKSIEKEQSKELMELLSSIASNNLNLQQAKQKIIEGVISFEPNWTVIWSNVHTKNEQLGESMQQQKAILCEKQQQLQKLTQEVREIEQELSKMEEQKQTLTFYEKLLEPIAGAERELRGGFDKKLKNRKHVDFTLDEVSLFLNVCGMQELVRHQRLMKIDGEVLDYAIDDVSVMEIDDRLVESKMKFFLKVLESGKVLKEEELSQSAVWRHRGVEKTLLLLNEWEIALDAELVRKKEICISHLLFFKAKDLQKELGVERKEAMETGRKLKLIKKEFLKFLQTDEDLQETAA